MGGYNASARLLMMKICLFILSLSVHAVVASTVVENAPET